MAAVYKHKGNSPFRVVYTLRLPFGTVRRSRYAQTRAAADQLRRALERVEDAVRAGAASVEDIEAWIGRGWLKEDEAGAAFPLLAVRRRVGASGGVVDWGAIYRVWADGALTRTALQDASRKSYRNTESMGRWVLAWLQEHAPALDMAARDVEAWRDRWRREVTPWTVHHRLNKLRQILDAAGELGYVASNPAREVRQRQPVAAAPRRALTADEARRVLDVAAHYTAPISGGLPTVACLGLYAGLRVEEMTWAAWGWVEWESGTMAVQRTTAAHGEVWQPKSGRPRVLDLKAELLDHLREVRQRRGADAGQFVLLGGNDYNKQHYRNRPLYPSSVTNAWRRMVAAEGLDPRITPHALRHTYATQLLRAGVDLATVQERMGHSSIRTTAQYLHGIAAAERPTDALPY